MNKPFALDALSVIEEIESQEHEEDVLAIFYKFITKFGFNSVLIGQLVNPILKQKSDLPIALSTWPDEWSERWLKEKYIIHDPITQYLLKSRKPFLWSTAHAHATKFGKKIVNESRDFNFKDGIVFPISTGTGPLGCISIGADIVDLQPKDLAILELVAIHCYMHLEKLTGQDEHSSMINLSKREIEVLHYVAEGKTNWEIASILHLSEHSIKEYLHNASQKLNSTNRAHSVSLAIQRGYIIP
ncbi:MAG: LuxR family transcriptional regulator [Robiginitomaculum sp.]|nr:LuxR family transcriptional regulator [Robiginitomaculum sp.]